MTFQQLSEEIKVKIAEVLKSKEIQDFVEKTKAATDSGNFEVVISTADLDRQGEIVDQNGLDFTFYKMNPVVLWAHDYYGLPIGIADEIGTNQEGKTIAKGRFAPAEANPFAQQVRKLYDLKIVQTTSVGMIVKEKQGSTITKAELLEFSFVPVPANPFALSLSKAQELGLDLAMLTTKGIAVEAKAEGDACTMDDGTAGEMKPDGNGTLVCMPKPETKPEVNENTIRIPVKDAANYDADSIRTIDIDADKGIKALIACPSGEYSEGKCNIGVEVITYLFDAEKWTQADAQAWVDEHEKSAKATKGDIAEQVNQDEMRRQKWEKLDRVWNIFDAFIGVYLDDATAVADFDKLLDETITLMKTPADQITDGAVGKAANTKERKAVIVKAAEAQFESIIAKFEKLTATFEKILKGDAGKVLPNDEEAQKQRSQDEGLAIIGKLDEFLMTRQILKSIATQTSEALERMNKKLHSNRHA